MSNLLPCPICGDKLKIHGPEDWKPTRYDPDSGGDPYSASCDCGFHYSNGSYDYSEFILCLNRRARQENGPLTLDELRQMDGCNDGTPIWIEPTGKYEGVWTAAWYIWPWDTKDFEIDTYADAWLAYRSKPREE